jgi:serine/threonine protein kinase
MECATKTLLQKPRDGKTFTFVTADNQEVYTIVKRIGKGKSRAKVYLCLNENKERVAIKTIKIDKQNSDDPTNRCNLIIEGLELVHDHALEYVVKILVCYHYPKGKDKQLVCTVMNYYEHGDLHDYLKAKQMTSEDTVTNIMKQLAFSLSTLHYMDILHRDIKVC